MNHHHMKHSAQPEVERPLSPARQAWLMLVVIAPMCGSMRSCRRSTRCCGRELNQRLRPRPTQSTLLRPSRRPMATQERIPRQSPNRRSKPHRKKNDPTTRFQPDAPISGMKSLDGVNTPWRPLCFPTYNQLKLKLSRQPKVSALFRIFAGTFALLWLVGTVFSIGCVCNCADHGEACAADASPIHEHAAQSAQEQGHAHTANAHQHATVLNISLSCAAREHAFAAPPSETLRRAKRRDWVFTPGVCLGPAFRSLAPPICI